MSDADVLSFVVLGRPRPKGSARPIKTKDGRIFMQAPSQSTEWQNSVAEVAHRSCNGRPHEGAVQLFLSCYFERPKGHYGTGRNRAKLRPSAPPYPTTRSTGDASKLARAIEDALTGIVYRDDSQIVDEHVIVRWTEDMDVERAEITVRLLEG